MEVTKIEGLANAREEEIRLDGSQCLKRKRTKEIKNDEKHIKEKKRATTT
jgi:hypothetical protein